MNKFNQAVTGFVDSGVRADTPNSDARYIRFLNATLLLFGLGQLPIISLLGVLGLTSLLMINLGALFLIAVGYVLNRSGHHLLAKIVVLGVVTLNTTYFAVILGSSAPTHLWLIPGAVLGVLVFKPSEWIWAAALVGLSMLNFSILEFIYLNIDPAVQQFSSPEEELQAAQGSTVSAMMLTLALIGMMHRRFARSEAALSKEKAQSDRLLRAILPEKIARELRETGTTQAVRHEDVSFLFADIVGFTPLSASMQPEEVVAMLAEIFQRFDQLITDCGVEKIKTIGDAYMVASGVPEYCPDHAERLVRCAVGMLQIMKAYSEESGRPLQLRIGLNRGPAVAGVIGTTKFNYDLWGDAVNLASRLESSGEPGRIQVSQTFKTRASSSMQFEKRGEIELKGVGLTPTYWLIPDE